MSDLLHDANSSWSLLLASLRDPASNPLAALLGLAAITLVLLIILIILYLLLTRSSSTAEGVDRSGSAQDKQAYSGFPKRSNRRLRRIVGAGAIVLMLVGAIIAGAYTSTDGFCAECHFTERAFESRAETPHKGVACRDCHEGGSAWDYLDAKSRGMRNAVGQLAGRSSAGPVPAKVADSACLACHEDVVDGYTVARSIGVRHAEIISAGYHCTECHNTEGHGIEVARPQYPEMRYCITCHDGRGASQACEACHAADPGVAVRRSRRVFPKTNVRKEDCRGCHSMQPCIDCHGLELPHSRKFVEGYHALKAYTDLNTCLTCHDLYLFCTGVGCHNFALQGIVSADGLRRIGEQHKGWATFHGRPASQCAGCHGDSDVCRYCHGEQPDH